MDEIRQFRGARGSLKRKKNKQGGGPSFKKVDRPVIIADGDISVAALATLIEKSGVDVVKHLMLKLGVLASLTQSIDAATARAVADAFEKKWVRSEAELANDYDEDDDDDDYEYEESAMERGSLQVFDDDADLMPRAPVVTIMGHVDHGKTSLLDALRSTRVAAGEQGGITQAIGAYSVPTPNGPVTFIDTPGHAAFAEMRERGANVTDIVILVVAADDGVKQQTVDSIACAKAARVPVVVVINKMDAPGADAARVETELTAYDLVSEKLGGDTMFCRVSAKERTGLTELLEALTLQAELLELKANPNAEASGAVVESNIKQGLGVVATTLIQRGTLNVGDIFVAGAAWGRVRSLLDEKGQQLETAGPSRAVQVVGWQSGIEHIPVAGDAFNVVPDEQTARRVTEARQTIYNEVKASKIRALSGAALASFFAGNDVKEQRDFTVLIKGDTAGSVEALTSSLARIDVQDDVSKVSAKVVYGGVGDVTKSDMAVASVSNAFVLAFNVGAQQAATVDERRLKIKIRYYGIVYDALDDIEARMRKILSPTPDGDLVGTAVVKQLFEIGKLGKVAGCGVLSGYMARSANIRVMSGDEIKFQGKLKTLRNLKTDVSRVDEGSDCGLSFRDWDEIQVGDTVECYDV
ncbi:hypothetical protein M885DRAFT_449468 [Pelagophyceae sp. CCMP2097]|nr:hypothetical protein M885DRAFT_449468 [Pelagophyceae sp. CCMP2097]